MRQFVAVALIKDKEYVLAQHRDNIPTILGPNTWTLPGGAKEDIDENLKHAAVREIEEETDYKLNATDLKLLTKDVYKTEKGVEVERIIYIATYDGKQEIHCNEGQEMRFIHEEAFKDIDFYQGHREFCEKAIQETKRC